MVCAAVLLLCAGYLLNCPPVSMQLDTVDAANKKNAPKPKLKSEGGEKYARMKEDLEQLRCPHADPQ